MANFISKSFLTSFWNRVKQIPTSVSYTINNASKTLVGSIDDLYSNKAEKTHTHTIDDTHLLRSELDNRLYALGINQIWSGTDGWFLFIIETVDLVYDPTGTISFKVVAFSCPRNRVSWGYKTTLEIICGERFVIGTVYEPFPPEIFFKLYRIPSNSHIVYIKLNNFYGNM